MRRSAKTGSSALPPLSRILPGFDWDKLRRHVEAADLARPPTQPELAEQYDTDELTTIVTRFPHVSLDEIVSGIAAQDPRMLQHGQTLLARRLRRHRPRSKADEGA